MRPVPPSHPASGFPHRNAARHNQYTSFEGHGHAIEALYAVAFDGNDGHSVVENSREVGEGGNGLLSVKDNSEEASRSARGGCEPRLITVGPRKVVSCGERYHRAGYSEGKRGVVCRQPGRGGAPDVLSTTSTRTELVVDSITPHFSISRSEHSNFAAGSSRLSAGGDHLMRLSNSTCVRESASGYMVSEERVFLPANARSQAPRQPLPIDGTTEIKQSPHLTARLVPSGKELADFLGHGIHRAGVEGRTGSVVGSFGHNVKLRPQNPAHTQSSQNLSKSLLVKLPTGVETSSGACSLPDLESPFPSAVNKTCMDQNAVVATASPKLPSPRLAQVIGLGLELDRSRPEEGRQGAIDEVGPRIPSSVGVIDSLHVLGNGTVVSLSVAECNADVRHLGAILKVHGPLTLDAYHQILEWCPRHSVEGRFDALVNSTRPADSSCKTDGDAPSFEGELLSHCLFSQLEEHFCRQEIEKNERNWLLGLREHEVTTRRVLLARGLVPLKRFLKRYVVSPFRARKVLRQKQRDRILWLEEQSRRECMLEEKDEWSRNIVAWLVPEEEELCRKQLYRVVFLSYYAFARVQLGALMAMAYDELYFLPREECEARWSSIFPRSTGSVAAAAIGFPSTCTLSENDNSHENNATGYYVCSEEDGRWYWFEDGSYYALEDVVAQTFSTEGPQLNDSQRRSSPTSLKSSMSEFAATRAFSQTRPQMDLRDLNPSVDDDNTAASEIPRKESHMHKTRGRENDFGPFVAPFRYSGDAVVEHDSYSASNNSPFRREGVRSARPPSPSFQQTRNLQKRPSFHLVPAAIADTSYAMWDLTARENGARSSIIATWYAGWLAGKARSQLVEECEWHEQRQRNEIRLKEESRERVLLGIKYLRSTAIKQLIEKGVEESYVRHRIMADEKRILCELIVPQFAKELLSAREREAAASFQESLHRRESLARREEAKRSTQSILKDALFKDVSEFDTCPDEEQYKLIVAKMVESLALSASEEHVNHSGSVDDDREGDDDDARSPRCPPTDFGDSLAPTTNSEHDVNEQSAQKVDDDDDDPLSQRASSESSLTHRKATTEGAIGALQSSHRSLTSSPLHAVPRSRASSWDFSANSKHMGNSNRVNESESLTNEMEVHTQGRVSPQQNVSQSYASYLASSPCEASQGSTPLASGHLDEHVASSPLHISDERDGSSSAPSQERRRKPHVVEDHQPTETPSALSLASPMDFDMSSPSASLAVSTASFGFGGKLDSHSSPQPAASTSAGAHANSAVANPLAEKDRPTDAVHVPFNGAIRGDSTSTSLDYFGTDQSLSLGLDISMGGLGGSLGSKDPARRKDLNQSGSVDSSLYPDYRHEEGEAEMVAGMASPESAPTPNLRTATFVLKSTGKGTEDLTTTSNPRSSEQKAGVREVSSHNSSSEVALRSSFSLSLSLA